jgi:outer membrane protein assembly factor BamB
LSLAPANFTQAGDWPQFRGPNGTGVSAETGIPTEWGRENNIRWKADLPGRGISSPVVAADRVYVTACTGPLQERLHILCFDAATGKPRWHRELWATGNTMCNPKTCMAAPTPVTDGRYVYALFATGDLTCFTSEGNLVWYRALVQDYPAVTNQVGMAASPVLWNDVLLVPLESAGESFVAGLDVHNGRNRWKATRPRDINWATPLVVTHAGKTDAVFESPQDLTAFDPLTGDKRWSYRGPGLNSIPSPVLADGLLILPSGTALRPPKGGSVPETVWKTSKLHPAYATPLCRDGRLYVINSGTDMLHAADARTGKVLWTQRLGGPISASPVFADGHLYIVNEEGRTYVVAPTEPPRIVSRNELGETMLATPAIANGAIYLRSDPHLYCIASVSAK